MRNTWQQIVLSDGTLVYEGHTLNGKPFGSGTSFFPNGIVYQEGVFGIKGLQCGREYYPSGQLRFEGVFRLLRAYGPNYPIYGDCYDENGKRYYSGVLKHRFGGVGYPVVIEPKEYGSIVQAQEPKLKYLSWQDFS